MFETLVWDSYVPEFLPYWMKISVLDVVSRLSVIDSAVRLPNMTVPEKASLVVTTEAVDAGVGCVAVPGGTTLQPIISIVEVIRPAIYSLIFTSISVFD
jgi:hypothetical protein